MNAAPPGGRDDYSQIPVTARKRQEADEALLELVTRETGGTLIFPTGSTWRRGDGTQSAVLENVILINFQDTGAKAVAKTLGDIQLDHLCLHLDRIFETSRTTTSACIETSSTTTSACS